MKTMTWAPRGQATLGAIRARQGQMLDRDLYWSFLRSRLQELVEEAEDEDLAQASELLMEAGLTYVPLDRESTAEMIAESLSVREAMLEKGIPGPLPQALNADNRAAQIAFDETNLLDWATALARGRIYRT